MNSPDKNKWEIEFDKECKKNMSFPGIGSPCYKVIVDFISKTHHDLIEQIKKEVEIMSKSLQEIEEMALDQGRNHITDMQSGYNKALSDILTKLSKLSGGKGK